MSINPYESPKEQGTFSARDRPILRSIIRSFTLLLGILCGTALATILSLTFAFSGVNTVFSKLGMNDGLFIGGVTVFSIVLGAFLTFLIHIKLSRTLLRLFGAMPK